MSRDYSIIRSRFWTHGTGKQLRGDGDAQRVALYLMSAPDLTMIGIYPLPIPLLGHHIGMPNEGASKALQRVCDLEFAAYDANEEIVFVYNLAREQTGESLVPTDNRHKAVVKCLEHGYKHTKHRFYFDFIEQYGSAYQLPADLLGSPLQAPSKGVRSQYAVVSRQEAVSSRQEPPPLRGGCEGGATAPPPAAPLELSSAGRAIVLPARKRKPPKDPMGQQIATAATWDAYAEAYRRRYPKSDPRRNAKINGQLAQIVKRIPADDAPHVAAAYLRSNNGYYIAKGHSVGCLLADIETLRTEWLTGRSRTQHQAREADKREGRGAEYDEAFRGLENIPLGSAHANR